MAVAKADGQGAGAISGPSWKTTPADQAWPGIDEAIAGLDYRYYNGYPMRIL